MPSQESHTHIDAPDVDTFGTSNTRKVEVSEKDGFVAHAEVAAQIELPQQAAWQLLTHEENHKVFKSIKV